MSPRPSFRFVQVALNVPLRTLYTYQAARGGHDLAGRRVRVPFGKRSAVGIVVRSAPEPDSGVRELEEVLDGAPVFDLQTLDFLVRHAEREFVPPGQLIHAALPPLLRKPRPFKPDLAYRLAVDRPTLAILSKGEERALTKLEDDGILTSVKLSKLTPSLRRHAMSLAAKGILRSEIDPGGTGVSPDAVPSRPESDAGLRKLRKAAQGVVAGEDPYAAHIVLAPPGAGRLEICRLLLSREIHGRRQGLVLAPTPAGAEAAAGFLEEWLPRLRIGVIHSRSRPRHAANTWLAAAAGRIDVLVGTRAAALAPLPSLALAVIEEAHSHDFRQEENPRYSAVQALRERCRETRAGLVLCTATPSLEDYWRTLPDNGSFRLHLLPKGVVHPKRSRVALHDASGQQNFHGLASPLIAQIKRRIRKGERAAVLAPRRGWAAKLYCRECGRAMSCPACMLPFTVGDGGRILSCALCGFEQGVERKCPQCGKEAMREGREGAKQIESGLRKSVRDARFLGPAGHDRIGSGSCDVAVVVRMDPAFLDRFAPSLVIAASVDERLASFNFRSAEALMCELCDLARMCAGAKLPPALTVQTRSPEHPLLRAFVDGGTLDYWDLLLAERRRTKLPPYGALGAVRAQGPNRAKAVAALADIRGGLAAVLRESGSEARVMGVIDSNHRLRPGMHRAHFAVRAPDAESVREALRLADGLSGDRIGSVRIEYDPDPGRL